MTDGDLLILGHRDIISGYYKVVLWREMAGSIGEVQLDALPYSDQGYEEPGVREMVSL